MRVREIRVDRWRNLEGIHLQVPGDVDLVCLVGENGSGKTNLLEILATAAPHPGLAPQAALKRVHPRDRQEPFGVSVTLDVRDSVPVDAVPPQVPPHPLDEWDGTVRFGSAGADSAQPPSAYAGTSTVGAYLSWWTVAAGGVHDDAAALRLGSAIAAALQQRSEVLHLYVDAERVFPPPNVRDDEVLALARQDMQAPGWVRQQASVLSENLYLQWVRQMLGLQQRLQGDYYEIAKNADQRQEKIPPPEDLFAGYARALQEVLPHLRFVRLDQQQRRLVFDSAGSEIAYEDLSGGEREVAFLVGQIERFGMRDGLFLIDEPELHLNAELLRAWLEYLQGTVDHGQVWLATHALEAVEVAGSRSTLVCERALGDRVVRTVSPLGTRPVLATLAGQLGSPGFSLARSRFVLIEGDRPGRERERFARILDSPPTDRFLESGGCGQVLARLEHVRAVASETEQLRIGAVIDRDMRTDEQVKAIEDSGAFVLPTTEIENLFLYPELVDAVAAQHGLDHAAVRMLVRALADRHAGRWMFERASQQCSWSEPLNAAAGRARSLTCTDVQRDTVETTKQIVSLIPGLTAREIATRAQRLRTAFSEWLAVRRDPNRLWREAFGKELLRDLAPALGLSDTESYEKRALQLWRSGEVSRPEDAASLRDYLDGLPAVGG